LLDIHDRSHRTLKKLLEHCRQLDANGINLEMRGFGHPTIRLQLFHIIGTEKYWIGVLQGRLEDDTDQNYPTIDSLEEFRQQISESTQLYLKSASNDELNIASEMFVDPGVKRILKPAQVFFRVLTHAFHHQGQILAMCRLLGKPGDGIYYPLD
jgi:uncharacterized damage-inducible protein DinB